ncbi:MULTISPECIES: DNA gyrase inhibitor YacG [Pandoraea]|uniref:DNA gyrase inhibitor YacG n=1 Tax=Pandoraea capi TaxID=2508286 RepID=A0ABY6VRQ3_9BURK|nr:MULTISPECIES: DNA gyrase inhibitor YacG [Pandoraea]MCI3207726.1 DNA gyrase inhibitor YacG [Pandoraea sp. LA3]MDN4585755.1 DNA gyrase inhibitor YacG [Pandoraea capi]ODP34886.1 pilus assembly protein [Pandoraea sp. ISTKB]VVD72421.1 pilus assembly protein [Pandoraea capi]
MTSVVNCPTCGKKVAWEPKSKFRPFCSERCKQIDMGAWAAEKYTIPAESPEDPSQESPLDPTQR